MTLSAEQSSWLEEVYRAHHQRVFLTCLRFALRNRSWAQDRTQEVFVKLAEHMSSVQNKDDPGGWLYRVSVHTCFMQMRKERGLSRAVDQLKRLVIGAEPSVAPRVDARLTLSELERALAELPPKQRAIMVLVYLEQQTQSEAAQLLDLSKGQVSKLHKKALLSLKKRGWEVDDA